MDERRALELKFYDILGNKNVYFQPPENVKLHYPCIVFHLDGIANAHADNKSYHYDRRYLVTHIYKDLSNEKIDAFLNEFMMISHDSRFTSDNLYHDVYTLYW